MFTKKRTLKNGDDFNSNHAITVDKAILLWYKYTITMVKGGDDAKYTVSD